MGGREKPCERPKGEDLVRGPSDRPKWEAKVRGHVGGHLKGHGSLRWEAA